MKNLTLLIIFGLVISGCNSQITDFVKAAVRPTPAPLAESNASSKAIKISPGSVVATGSHVRANATITTTNHMLKGTQVQATLSISQSRKN